MEKLLASSGHKILINENCPCSKEHLDTTTKLIVAIYVCVIQTFLEVTALGRLTGMLGRLTGEYNMNVFIIKLKLKATSR